MNSTNEKSAIAARLKSARMQLKLKQKEFATAGESQQNFGFAVAVFQGRQGFRDFCHVNGIIG